MLEKNAITVAVNATRKTGSGGQKKNNTPLGLATLRKLGMRERSAEMKQIGQYAGGNYFGKSARCVVSQRLRLIMMITASHWT